MMNSEPTINENNIESEPFVPNQQTLPQTLAPTQKITHPRPVKKPLHPPRLPFSQNPVSELFKRSKNDIVVHTIDGCRKLVCNMTLLVNNKRKEVFIIDSGKGMEDISSAVPVVTKAILERVKTRTPNFKSLVDYYRRGYKIIGFMITHIHADHIGSFVDCKNYLEAAGIVLDFKVYGSKITLLYGATIAKCSYFKTNFEVIEDRQLKIINEQFKFYPIQVNHSAPETMGGYFKIGDKTVLYIPDSKLDFDPVIGVNEADVQAYYKKVNATEPDAVVIESTCVSDSRPYVTEGEVAATLKKILLYNDQVKDTIIITTFASNAARLLSILKAVSATNRKVGVYGRSMCNALNAYFEAELIPLHLKSLLVYLDNFNVVNHNKKNFVILCTGHQGEPSAALPRMVNDQLGYKWSRNDLVIFSSTQIPAMNAEISRSILMCELKQRRVEVIDRVHCSGHISKKDALRIISSLRNCKKYIINHGDFEQMVHYYDILSTLGINEEKLILGKNDWSYGL